MHTAAVAGLEGEVVKVEVDTSRGYAFLLNGVPRLSCAEDAWYTEFISQDGNDSLITTQSDLAI